MTREELKQVWGKYCDTDKLVTEMQTLLRSNNIRNYTNGICEMLNVFFRNKASIIEMMQNSDNYVGDLRIMVDTQMNRYNTRNVISDFVRTFYDNVEADKILLKYKDGDGKTIHDYFKIGKTKVTVKDVTDGKMNTISFNKWDKVFDSTGATQASMMNSRRFYDTITCFNGYTSPTVTAALSNMLNQRHTGLKIAEGTKTSRAFNKVCHLYEIDSVANGIAVKVTSGAKFVDGTEVPNDVIGREIKVKSVDGDNVMLTGVNKAVDKKYLSNVKYNKLFAEYSDMVVEKKRNIKFYISVNPIDYLTMSVGRSWRSCHAFGGSWFGGTVSYMLDSVSIITFVHDEVPTNFATEGKIYRTMFHYKDGTLLQSRVYPQGNDGCTNLYAEFRKIMQNEISDMVGSVNSWTRHSLDSFTIRSVGNHYKDYLHNGSCNVTVLGNNHISDMTIGHINVCPVCGREEPLNSCQITHYNCNPI